MATELKPCPFCGGNAQWATSNLPDDFEIQCANPKCRVLILANGPTEADAAAAWNQRYEIGPIQ